MLISFNGTKCLAQKDNRVVEVKVKVEHRSLKCILFFIMLLISVRHLWQAPVHSLSATPLITLKQSSYSSEMNGLDSVSHFIIHVRFPVTRCSLNWLLLILINVDQEYENTGRPRP